MIRLLTFFTLLAPAPHAVAEEKPVTRIAFGSCATQEKPLPIFKAVIAAKPELMVWLGDNIYADTQDMDVMRAQYAKLMAVPEYKQLRQLCPNLAVWDDHDYGKNDAGAEYPKKDESQQVFLDFFEVPKDSPRRAQKGVYNAAVFGPPGKRVQLILLDGRYFRSPLKRGKREPGMTYTPYVANNDPDVTILGEEQWKWLGEQLQQPAEVRLIGSGIQVVAEDHGFEKWMNFPKERERLFQLLRDSKAAGVVLLSGDRHLAELSMMEGAVDYPLYDLTASGFNQGSHSWRPLEKNRHRVATMPSGDNFGVVTIDWEKGPKLALQIRDVDGDISIRHKLLLSDLQPGAHAATKETVEADAHVPAEGTIAATAALKRVGEKVTIEMKVQSVGGSPKKRLFLNSRKNFRDEENLAVVLTPKAFVGNWEKAAGETFLGKVVRVTGTVSKFSNAPQILIEDGKQIEIVGESKKE
jgi:alkaline phosphatase D